MIASIDREKLIGGGVELVCLDPGIENETASQRDLALFIVFAT